MQLELIVFIIMLGVFMIGCFKFKLPVSISMVISSIAGILVSGVGFDLRHLIEGVFGFIDTMLVIATAMIFMKTLQHSGTLDTFKYQVINKFHRQPILIALFMTAIVMFPGMITGSATAAVLSAGSLVAPVLIAMGMNKVSTAALVALGGMLGMLAPPVNVPVMIIGGGIDMPYTGFTLPLLLITIPLAIFCTIYLCKKEIKEFDINMLKGELEKTEIQGFKVYIPIIALIIIMVVSKALPSTVPQLGLPLTFIICSILALFTGRNINPIKVMKESINDSLPVLGILAGVGMFIQVMTLTGVRGFVVVECLSLPAIMLYIAIAVSLPLFGAVSSYGAASVLGVPFVLALIAKDQIIVASAIALIASLGDLMPPTALAGIFAAQVVGLKEYRSVLKKCLVPSIVFIIWGLAFIAFADKIARFV